MGMDDQDAEVIKHLREQLQTTRKQNADLKALLQLGYKVHQMLMPGLKHISVPDYSALNTFGVQCTKLLDIKNESAQDRVGDPGNSASSGDAAVDKDKADPESSGDG